MPDNEEKFYSTTALSKELGISTQALFEKLTEQNLIVRKSDNWELTPEGRKIGGRIVSNTKYGDYVAWPITIIDELSSGKCSKESSLMGATLLGEHFEIPSTRINLILSEIGWIKKELKGWTVTYLAGC